MPVKWIRDDDGWEAEIGDDLITLQKKTDFRGERCIGVYLQGEFWFNVSPDGAMMAPALTVAAAERSMRVHWHSGRFEPLARRALVAIILDGPMKEANL